MTRRFGATLSGISKRPAYAGFTLFAATILLNAFIQGPASFFSAKSMSTLFTSNLPFLLIVMAQSILLLSGTMDISVGVQVALVNVVTIMTMQEWGVPFILACCIGAGAAFAASILCWLLVSVFRLPALLASYALTYAIRGVNVLIMPIPQGKVAREFYYPYQNSLLFGAIPISALALVLALLIWAYARRTRFGADIYAVGANPRNAFAAGIDPVKVQLRAFLIKALFTGMAGICLTLLTASGNPNQAEDYGLRSLSACIIGGLSFGGWGSMACGVFGGSFLILIQNSIYFFFNMLYKLIPGFSVSTYWHNFVSDIIIFLGLLMTMVTAKGQREALKSHLQISVMLKRRAAYGK
jgi:ribose/xylose/arabinose/galactoside ABC-type transport system permease subunit